jgi:AcrR family transcriptional regulator
MEILRQAASVFREKGYHGAGMREIAKGIGVAPGALYYYFESKEDLLYACQDISLTRLLAVGSELAAASGPADARLRQLLFAHLDLTLDELGGSAAHVEFHALPEARLRQIVEKRDAYEAQIRSILEDGIRQGLFRQVDVKLATLTILGALNWTVFWWRPGGTWSTEDLVDGITDLVLGGLRVQASGTRGRETA